MHIHIYISPDLRYQHNSLTHSTKTEGAAWPSPGSKLHFSHAGRHCKDPSLGAREAWILRYDSIR